MTEPTTPAPATDYGDACAKQQEGIDAQNREFQALHNALARFAFLAPMETFDPVRPIESAMHIKAAIEQRIEQAESRADQLAAELAQARDERTSAWNEQARLLDEERRRWYRSLSWLGDLEGLAPEVVGKQAEAEVARLTGERLTGMGREQALRAEVERLTRETHEHCVAEIKRLGELLSEAQQRRDPEREEEQG